jgi:anaerobic selenocysteine-containing dehydrogenase
VENIFQLYLEPLRKFQLAAAGKVKPVPPEHQRDRIRRCFEPLPCWYPPFYEDGLEESEYPLHAITQRPAAMYHSWGSQNAWLRQIHGENALYVPGAICDREKLTDGDWALVTSPSGQIRVKVRRMDAVNGSTMWTWNAIGKRAGAWALDKGAPEATRGFLLNHLIDELLPPKGDGRRWANSDPITGQAAWFDLRVSIRRDPDQSTGHSLPETQAQEGPAASGPETVRFGLEKAQ